VAHGFRPLLPCVACLVLAAASARAADDISVRWTQTVRYSTAVRMEHADAVLLADPNSDDGNRNFRSSFVSNRADLLSELRIAMGTAQFEVSGAAWYDTLYDKRTGNDSPATLNTLSRGPDRFSRDVRKLHGRDAELLTASASAAFDVGDSVMSLRIGRAHLQWGESLFFADNGIAAGQTPIDAVKALSVPGSRAKEVFMPVAHAWAGLQPADGVALEAYYQLEWRKSRLPGAGSYFSAADFLDAGGERLIVGPGQFFRRATDQSADASGQFGLAVKFNRGDVDLGIYALRFNAKEPQVYLRLGPFVGTGATTQRAQREQAALYGVSPSVFVPGGTGQLRINYGLYGDPRSGEVGTYNLSYPEGIDIYGLSASGYVGDTTAAAEVSLRRKMPLVSAPLILFQSMAADNDNNARYAIGDTLHVQASTVTILPQGPFWQGAALSAEIAANHRLRVTRNAAALDIVRDRTAVSLRAQFEPQYFAVLPGLDVSVPVGFGVGLAGRSSINQGQNARVGDVEFGLRATYRAVWDMGLRFTHFLGPRSRQPFADRDFISLTLSRSF
jgi:hypothetical protein